MYKVLLENKDLIKQIVESKACSSIPRDLLDAVVLFNEQNKQSVCKYCSGSLFRAFNYVYSNLSKINDAENGTKKRGKRKTELQES